LVGHTGGGHGDRQANECNASHETSMDGHARISQASRRP
jgi:hypothetical protein